MKTNHLLCVLTTIAIVAFSLLHAETAAAESKIQQTFYVSPSGSDDSPGTEAAPFATIGRARNEVRKINKEMTGDIAVVLQGGTYSLDETLVFEPTDSGTGGHRVIYQAAPGETPIFSGGRRITGWKEDVDGRWKVPCDEHFRQLYVDGQRAVRARSALLKRKRTGSWTDLGFDNVPGIERFGENGYRTTNVAMADWRNPGDVELCYYVCWCHTRCKVESIRRDGDHAILRMVQPEFMLATRKDGVRVGLPHYLENALELLDEPGEWYLDRSTKVLYYKPRPGEDMNQVTVVAPILEKLVELHGQLDAPIENLEFRGLTFAYATWLQPSRTGLPDVQANFVQHMSNLMERSSGVNNVHNEDLKSPANVICRTAKQIRFERCNFAHLGGAGLDLEYGSCNNTVEGCHFYDISGSGIQVGGVERSDHHPTDERTAVRNNQILNNLIEDCAVEYQGGLGVFVGYTDTTVIAHNEIRNLPYSGVSVGWGWGEEDAGGGQESYYEPYKYDTPTPAKNNRIEYNHIHHIMQVMNDGATIYTLGNMPGSVIQKNHLHDSMYDFGGIYLDEGSGFIEITDNVVYRVNKAMNYNNNAQNRKGTCNEHDNWFGDEYTPGTKELPAGAQKVIDEAGIQPEYQDLLERK